MAHYLTFGSTVTCTVNGVSVTSGYELHNGDVIVVTSANMSFEVNEVWYSAGDTVNISDSDIVVYTSGGVAD